MQSAFVASRTAVLAVLLIGMAGGARADDHNVLANAGFETALTPGQGGWTTFEQGEISSKFARSGEHSMFHWAFSRTVPYPPYLTGAVSGSYQELPATAGSRWRLTGYGLTPAALRGTPAFGLIQVSFFDASGKDLGTVETLGSPTSRARTSNEINLRAPAGEWLRLDTGVATAPDGTATVQAFTLYVDYSGSGSAQGVYFDDLTLCALDAGETSCGDDGASDEETGR